MTADIWIVHQAGQFRLMFGYLHLAVALESSLEVFVDVRNEGKVRVIRTSDGLMIDQGACRSPLIHY